jgi:hypothetical protein
MSEEKPEVPMKGMCWSADENNYIMKPREAGCMECFDHPAFKPYCKRCKEKTLSKDKT